MSVTEPTAPQPTVLAGTERHQLLAGTDPATGFTVYAIFTHEGGDLLDLVFVTDLNLDTPSAKILAVEMFTRIASPLPIYGAPTDG